MQHDVSPKTSKAAFALSTLLDVLPKGSMFTVSHSKDLVTLLYRNALDDIIVLKYDWDQAFICSDLAVALNPKFIHYIEMSVKHASHLRKRIS